jgi:hypothetical protein
VVAPGAGLPSTAMESTTSAAAFGEALRGRARRALAEFRAASRFFKLRLGIVSAWALLSLVTLWATCPASGPANALGADVQVSGDSLLGGQVLVRNESARIWEDVVLTLDDGWRYTQATIRPHDLVVVSVAQFRRGDEAPPRDYRPRRLRIECAQGAGRFDLR